MPNRTDHVFLEKEGYDPICVSRDTAGRYRKDGWVEGEVQKKLNKNLADKDAKVKAEQAKAEADKAKKEKAQAA